tara:strand:- start:3543 stop:4217 length:675 start_codon:yes stop_codon:yes gene_type:complete
MGYIWCFPSNGNKDMQDTSSKKVGAKKTEIEQLRTKMLDAALVAFSENGFEGTSLRVVAKDAGTNHQNIAHYFGSKEDLWEAVINREVASIEKHIKTFYYDAEDEQPQEQLANYVRKNLDWAVQHVPYFRIYCQEGMRDHPRYEKSVLPHVKKHDQLVSKTFEHAKAAGVVKDIPAEELLFIYKGALLYRLLVTTESRFLTGNTLDDEEARDKHAEAVITLLLK